MVCPKTKGKVVKTGNFHSGAEPGAPDEWRNTFYRTSGWSRTLKFGMVIGIRLNPKGKFQNPKFLFRGGARGPRRMEKYVLSASGWSRTLKFIIVIGFALKLK